MSSPANQSINHTLFGWLLVQQHVGLCPLALWYMQLFAIFLILVMFHTECSIYLLSDLEGRNLFPMHSKSYGCQFYMSVCTYVVLFMLGAEFENGTLVSPLQDIDDIFRIRSGHMFVYLSASMSNCPSVQVWPYVCISLPVCPIVHLFRSGHMFVYLSASISHLFSQSSLFAIFKSCLIVFQSS
jgi:hypothetical protein